MDKQSLTNIERLYIKYYIYDFRANILFITSLKTKILDIDILMFVDLNTDIKSCKSSKR